MFVVLCCCFLTIGLELVLLKLMAQMVLGTPFSTLLVQFSLALGASW